MLLQIVSFSSFVFVSVSRAVLGRIAFTFRICGNSCNNSLFQGCTSWDSIYFLNLFY